MSTPSEHFTRGWELGNTIREFRAEGLNFDPRYDIADEAKALSHEDFAQFMDGLRSATNQEAAS